MGISVSRLAIAIQKPQRLGVVRAPTWTALIGVSILAVHLILIPFVARTWRTTGDEPHYLLAAHSLVTDLDFDLANNYDQQDYLGFYFSQDLNRQIRVNAAGQQILNHQLGLPVLIAPAYALAGRLGVLIFQAILGGLLAIVTFKLAVVIGHDEKAAVLATLFVVLSPPLLMYHYLVYPELIAALLTTTVVYYLVRQNRPTPGAAIPVYLSLLTLPWLNRRFVPLAILLALLVVWSWRRPGSLRGLLTKPGILSLLSTGLAVALLIWFNRQLQEPARIDVTAPSGALLWHRLARSIGWLLDQQRGLLIYAPIYVVAIWGMPVLIHQVLKRSSREWFVLLPFLLSLAVTAVAGGFWIAWELGPRFLVIGLPPLAPVVALAWRDYGRHKLGAAMIVALFIVSAGNSIVILRRSSLPYKSSLPLFYQQKLKLPFTEILPALAGYETISPADAAATASNALDSAAVIVENEALVWFAAKGRPLQLVQSSPLQQLPYGRYHLVWPLRVEPNLPPETELVRLSVNFLGGGQIFYKTISAGDLPRDGSYGAIDLTFLNTSVDRWDRPMVFHAVSTGQSDVWAKDVLFQPNPFYGWILPYFYLVLLIAGAVLTWTSFKPTQQHALRTQAPNFQSPDRTAKQRYPKAIPCTEPIGNREVPHKLEPTGETRRRRHRYAALFCNSNSTSGREDDKQTAIAKVHKILIAFQPIVDRVSWFLPWPTGAYGDPAPTAYPSPRKPTMASGLVVPAWLQWSWLVALLLAAVGYLIFQHSRGSHTYDVNQLYHFVGQAIADPAATNRRTWLVDPATDPPQKATFGPFDIYDAGLYRVTFRLKLPEMVETDQAIAVLQVNATANFDELATQPLRFEHFAHANLYHDFVLTVNNPRRQSLSFDVQYLGIAPLIIDQVTIMEVQE